MTADFMRCKGPLEKCVMVMFQKPGNEYYQLRTIIKQYPHVLSDTVIHALKSMTTDAFLEGDMLPFYLHYRLLCIFNACLARGT
eukprot:UN06307